MQNGPFAQKPNWVKFCAPNRSPSGESGVGFVRTISVRDGNGDEVTVYEFQDRRFLRKVRRMKLETGELVQLVAGSLVVVKTGEKLEPITKG